MCCPAASAGGKKWCINPCLSPSKECRLHGYKLTKSKRLNHTVWRCTLFSLLRPKLAFDSPLFSMFGFCPCYWGCALYFAFDALFAIAIGKFLDCFSSVLFNHEALRSTCVVVPAIEHVEFRLASAEVQQFFSEAVCSTSKTFLRFRFSTSELPEQENLFIYHLVEVDTHTHTGRAYKHDVISFR